MRYITTGCMLLAMSFPLHRTSGIPVENGLPEHTLAGVDVRAGHIGADLQRLGPADRITDRKHSAGGSERTYEWDRDGVRVQLESGNEPGSPGRNDAADEPITAELWGTQRRAFAHTGQGLFLGDGLGRAKQLYGKHFQKISGARVMLQWPNGTTLALDFDHTGRIIHMLLTAEN